MKIVTLDVIKKEDLTPRPPSMKQNKVIPFAFVTIMSTAMATVPKQGLELQGYCLSRNMSIIRSTSLKSDLSDTANSFGIRPAKHIYSPAHTPPSELANSKQESRRNILIMPESPKQDNPRVYTRIQTELYPEMRF